GAAPAFLEWNDPDVIHGATDFQRAAGKETGTFNWTYVDSRDVAYYMSGKLPVRNPHVNPNFPTWGTGQWEWQGFVPIDLSAADAHPRASTIPASGGMVNGTLVNGFFTNWNNKPAPGFSAADSNFAYGPVFRVQSLSDRVGAILGSRLATPADVVNAMEDGGSVDLDGSQLVLQMAAVLRGGTLTAAQAQVLSILQSWAADPFCGAGNGRGGNLASCRAALKSALQATIDQLTNIYGSSDPTSWTCSRANDTGGADAGSGQNGASRCNPELDDIQYSAVGVGTVPSMPWVNRPTFQQVVQYPAQRAP